MVGKHVVTRLERDGHDVIPLARRLGVDLTSGAGLAERLDGVDVLIDCLSVVTTKADVASEFFRTTTSTLLEAEREAGVGHHVALSIVGIDQTPTGYSAGKLEQERVIKDTGQPYTILRAPQFHEFALQMIERMKTGPFILAPRLLAAPASAADVADALVDLATEPPRRDTVEIAGPEQHQLPDMMLAVMKVRGIKGMLVRIPLPGSSGRAMRTGAYVAKDPWRVTKQTFAEWLAG